MSSMFSITGSIPARVPILMTPFVQSFAQQDYEPTSYTNNWNCKFDQDYCVLKNSYNMAQFQRLSEPSSPMFGQTSMLYINVTNAVNIPAARLESNYFTSYSLPFACLSVSYLMYGTGALKLFVIQQDVQNKCIFVDNNDSVDYSGQWRSKQMTIDLRDGNPRFFIEAHIDGRPPNYGTIAINSFAVTFGGCSYDDINYCQRKEDRPIPPVPSPVK